MAQAMQLSIIIPVRNDPEGLEHVLGQLATLEPGTIISQIVVVDDGSTVPLCLGTLQAAGGKRVELIRTEAGLGAGHARNLGLRRVQGSHLLFFDSDDEFHPGFSAFLHRLSTRDFDVAMFAHDDTRRLDRKQTGPDEVFDRAIWESLTLPAGETEATPSQRATLVRVSNYPWNKIWRSEFARRINLHATEIPVHNDITHHWSAFVHARQLLVCPERLLIHTVTAQGARLTNARGRVRMQVFKALEAVIPELDAAPYLAGPFLDFVFRLCTWIETLLDDTADRAHFANLKRQFLQHFARDCTPAVHSAVATFLLSDGASATDEAPGSTPGLANAYLAAMVTP